MVTCFIRCLNCDTEFNSPIQFGDSNSFFTSTLIGNLTTCPNCHGWTGCNKENMIFRAPDEGWVGIDVSN